MKTKSLLSILLFVFCAITQTNAANNSYNWLHAQAFNGMNSTGMTVNKNNNTYFYGFSYSDVKYGSSITPIDFATERSAIVVIKVNDQNVYQWTKKITVALSESSSFNVRSMDVDDDGNMYFGGDFTGTITVNSQTYDINDAYGYFIMKTDTDGNIIWFKASNLSHGSVHRLKYTSGRIAFLSAWSPNAEVEDLFGTDLLVKFGDLSHFNECDMMIGALSVVDGEIVFAHGIKTEHNLISQWYSVGVTQNKRNILDADNSGNIYVAGGFSSNQLRVSGTNYSLASGIEAAESQFVLRMGTFGEISWVKIITNASGLYPSLAVNNTSGVAVLFNGGANTMKIGDEPINVQGDVNNVNHIALLAFNDGALRYKRMINANTSQITTAPNGSFCVAGNLTSEGQSFGIDALYNGQSTRKNLFVGFYDSELNGIAGQSVISEGIYGPVAIKAGADGKIRMLGIVNSDTTLNNITYPFGDYNVPFPEGANSCVFSVLDPKPIIKAEIMTYAIDCGRYSININSNIKSKVQWYVNDVAKGTDFSLMGDDQMGGYAFGEGVSYIKAVLTDSTDATNTAEFRDTVTVYNPVVNINTQINPQTGVVNYSVVISNYAPTYSLDVDRGNYDYSTEPNGTYTYAPGTHTIKVSLSEMSNWNCFFHTEKTFIVPQPNSSQECTSGVIKGHVESSIASFLAGEVRVDLYGIANNGIHVPLKSDTIDSNGEFQFEGLSEGNFKIRANIIDPSKYPALLVTYFNNIMNQVTSWQDATPITLACNQWADLNLTFAAINELINGTGSISGVISYSNGGSQGAKAMVKASTQEGDVVVSNAPVILRKKITDEIVARTTTDENGMFHFENLPEDEYEIVVDIPGIPVESTYDVTISASNNEVENRNFLVTQTGIATTNQYAIVATATDGGTISNAGTKMLNTGEGFSYTIAPSSGQFLDDVLVNGQSVGKVLTYDFSNVISNQTIHAIFKMETAQNEIYKSVLTVYPVVFDKKITIFGLSDGSDIRIMNQLGAICHICNNGNNTTYEIEAGKLSQGIYFVQITNKSGIQKTFKMLKK